jgi:hypothetical protein
VPEETSTGPVNVLPADERVRVAGPSFSSPAEPPTGAEIVALWFAVTLGVRRKRRSAGAWAAIV